MDAKYFNHAAAVQGIVHSIVEAGVMVISGINPQKPFNNREKTMLSTLNVGGSIVNTVKLKGFTSAILPKEWVNIVVTNLSITEVGGFEVFLK